jgi:hypothetical protein
VAEISLAHPAHQSTTELQPAYVPRGLGLFELHRDEILAGYQGGGKWLIPSGTESGRVYEVRVGLRPERNRCECSGHHRYGHCSHVVCASIARKKSAICDCCGERRWWSELSEVQEEHGLLAWFVGDRICADCVRTGHWA